MAFNSALARPQQDRSMVGTQVKGCFLCRQPFDTGCGACCETFAGGLAGHARTPELRVWPNISTSRLLCPITFRRRTIPAGYSRRDFGGEADVRLARDLGVSGIDSHKPTSQD
jgi:hypothetical protein